MSEEDKKEGLLKKLKNIEDKNEDLLKIKNKTENIKEVTNFVRESLSLEAKALIGEITVIQKDVNYKKLILRGGNNATYDFSDYKTFNELFRDLYYKNMIINDAEMKQNEFNTKRVALNNYPPKASKYIEAKNSLLNIVNNFYKGTEKIIEGFKEKIFPLKSDDKFEDQQTSKKSTKEKEESEKNKFFEHIENESKDIDYGLFNYYFNFVEPNDWAKKIFEIKDKKKNNDFVKEIKNRWSKLKDEIEEMPEEKRKNEKPDKILKILKEILKFNKQNRSGESLKFLTPNQMLGRLPISLAQLKAGNNSEKLESEIRQLLYSLYRSKNMTKQV